MIEFELPCYIEIGTRKRLKISLNMNWYRNAHFQQLNAVKRQFKPVSGDLFKADEIRIHYTLHLATKRRTDVMNWIAIVDKFFCDWLVNMDCLPDDNYHHITGYVCSVVQDSSLPENKITANVEIIAQTTKE